jgi:Uma2 family endonuclease
MGDPAKRLLTYDDLEAAMQPDAPFVELVDGELRWDLSPRSKHGFSVSRVAGALDDLNSADGLWWILVDTDVRFSKHRVLRPDVGAWLRERMPELPDGPAEVAPDWICEVISRGHVSFERGRKADMYAEEGVRFLWLLDERARMLEVYRLHDGAWLRVGAYSDGDRPVLPPFEREFDVTGLFPPKPATSLAEPR